MQMGWHDEMDRASRWKTASPGRPALAKCIDRGTVQLSLAHVPGGWPYEYQWSGVTRDAKVDISRFPVLMARVTKVHGYAHMDIEVLDANKQVYKSFRASTLQNPGLTMIDFSKQLDPAIYTLRLRLIVGGPNEGCDATYDWVRFVSSQDADKLTHELGS